MTTTIKTLIHEAYGKLTKERKQTLIVALTAAIYDTTSDTEFMMLGRALRRLYSLQ